MRRFWGFLIVPVAIGCTVGCRQDNASRIAAPTDQDSSSTQMRTQSGTTTTPNEPAATISRPGDERPLVVCFGDSLTAGYGADDGQSYPDFLQKDLDHAGYRYRVVNEGISGNTTKDGVDRLSDVIDLHPAVVVLEFGGNDGLRGLKIQTTRTNLSTMITGLQHASIKVVIAGITLPPDYGPDYVNSFTNNYPTLAKKYNVPVMPFLLKDVYGVDGLMQADNMHATNKGNEIVARNVLPFVAPLLKR